MKIPPQLALVLMTGTIMWLLCASAPSFAWQVPYGRAIAIVLGVASVIVAALGVVSLRRAGTTVNPTKPQATASLVSSGWMRSNPSRKPRDG